MKTTKGPRSGDSTKRVRAQPRPAGTDDLLTELDAAFPLPRLQQPGEITAWEYAAARGLTYVTARYRLNAMVERGEMERVTGVTAPGHVRAVTVWRKKRGTSA